MTKDPTGEPRDEAQEAGRALLAKVSICFKLASLHQLGNAALAAPISGLVATVNELLRSGDGAFLQILESSVFYNRELLRLDFAAFEGADTLMRLMRKLGVEEVGFPAPISEDDLRAFLAVFQACLHGKKPGQLVVDNKTKIAVRAIDKARRDDLASDRIDERQEVVRSYGLLAVTLEDTLARILAGKPPRLARLRRAVQGLVDVSAGHEGLLVGLTRFPALSGRPHYHAAATVALSLLMGRRLGVPRSTLSELGLAAAVHDVARDGAPGEGAGGQDTLAAVPRVGMRSMLALCRANASPEMLGLAALAHQTHLEASGRGGQKPHALARLVGVACAFDLLTSKGFADKTVLPDRALRLLFDQAPARFDEAVVKLLAATVGLYPVGTTVKLSGGEKALVLEVPSDPSLFARPRVKVFQTPRGPADYVVDLADPGCKVSIAAATDPAQEPIEIPALLLA